MLILSTQLISQAQQVVALEYFVDTDPGFGNATTIVFNPDSVIQIVLSLNLNTISSGHHSLYFRTKDDNGNWSMTSSKKLVIPALTMDTDVPDLSSIEYFVDADPGFGNGFSINLSNDSVVTNQAEVFDLSSATFGNHQLYTRAKDIDGKYSFTTSTLINLQPDSSFITQIEYFFDTDPGVGNATSILFTPDSVINGTLNVPLNGMSTGFHNLGIRTKNSYGYGHTDYRLIFLEVGSNSVINNITNLEYFLDHDPGVGNGTLINVNSSSTITQQIAINLNNISTGFHLLGLRAKDSSGKFGLFEQRIFFVSNDGANMPPITAMEVFYDNDPGVGNGIAIPVNSGQIISQTISTTIPSNLGIGAHRIILRARDSIGNWSLFDTANVVINPPVMTNLELKLFIEGYYIGNETMGSVLMNQGLSNPSSQADSVIIELHNHAFPFNIEHTTIAILDTDGHLNCNFPLNVAQDSFYIAIRHRNAIETWTANPVTFSFFTNYDFSDNASKAFASNQKLLETNVFGIYSGDINQDGNIDIFDYLQLDPDMQNFEFGYKVTDLNGDGNVDIFDYLIYKANGSMFVNVEKPL